MVTNSLRWLCTHSHLWNHALVLYANNCVELIYFVATIFVHVIFGIVAFLELRATNPRGLKKRQMLLLIFFDVLLTTKIFFFFWCCFATIDFQNRSRRGTIDFVLFVFVRAVVVAVAVDLVAVVVLRPLLARPPLLRRRSKYHQGRPLWLSIEWQSYGTFKYVSTYFF